MVRSSSSETTHEAILVTGGTGFLGSLVAARALTETNACIVLPVREPQQRQAVLDRITSELVAEGRSVTDDDLARLVTVTLPAPSETLQLVPTLQRLGVRSILHCAGCLSYFNVKKLQEGNIELTRSLLTLGKHLGVRRFVYLSTAYSCGFVDGQIAETLHEQPGLDPTDYTRTKREAEHLVAESGLPYIIVRPSIVIGDSRDGRYGGKPYGVYQLWTAGEKYLSGAFPPVLHVIAADNPVNFVHQDAFTDGFWAAYTRLPDGAVIHLASREDGLPSMLNLWQLWMNTYGGPNEVHLYDHVDDVPKDEVDAQLQLWLDFTAVNNDIASVRWDFRLDNLERLRREGLHFADATLDSLKLAQTRYVADSPKVQRFIDEYRTAGNRTPRLVLHSSRQPDGARAAGGS